jgi:GH15 family glucan-1,4-alpha-glucosidase
VPSPIADYAFLSDLESAALVGRDGSIDWLTFPRFDSGACFAALLGGPDNGRWLLAPVARPTRVERRYRDGSLVLETVFTTDEGEVAVIDCMPPRDDQLDVIRLVEGRRGRVAMRMELIIRFDYGSIVPWVRRIDGELSAVGGPDALRLRTPIELRAENMTTVASFSVGAGDTVPFQLTWHPSENVCKEAGDPVQTVAEAERWWQQWCDLGHKVERPWHHAVRSSAAVLKGLTYAPTGALVAAATTSLPEKVGGVRNWDYRYGWLRDATFSLLALLAAGYEDEARAWRDWLLRAAAGDPRKLQIMYGIAGERRLPELELDWLPGYRSSAPVRIGNDASKQFQLDVYGEVMDALYHAGGEIEEGTDEWSLQLALMDFLESGWDQPDEGLWEVRGPRRHFTHSKVMAWVAVDRAVRSVEELRRDGPVAHWRELRTEIEKWVLTHCVDDRGVFVQHPDTRALDASLLMIPLVGFLPGNDERVVATVDAIDRELTHDGFVLRYISDPDLDGLPEGEGAFLLCSFWMVQALVTMGRIDDATARYEKLLALRNDVGLLSEEYDPDTKQLLGNIPQAFSHTALINSAVLLSGRGRARGESLSDADVSGGAGAAANG